MAPRRLAAVEMQPKNFAFSAENLEWAKVELTKYPYGRQESAILALLWRAQAQAGGWLPEAAIRYVADFLGMAHIRALEVATFYTMFNLEPVGRYHIQLCGTTPCVLRGAEDLKRTLREKVGKASHPDRHRDSVSWRSSMTWAANSSPQILATRPSRSAWLGADGSVQMFLPL